MKRQLKSILMVVAVAMVFILNTSQVRASEISYSYSEETTFTSFDLMTYRKTVITGNEEEVNIKTLINGIVTSDITLSQSDVRLIEKLVAATGADSFNAKISIAACPINRLKYGYASSIEEAIKQIADINMVKNTTEDTMSLQATRYAILGLDPEGKNLGEDTLYVFPANAININKKVVDGNYEFFSSEGYNEIFR